MLTDFPDSECLPRIHITRGTQHNTCIPPALIPRVLEVECSALAICLSLLSLGASSP